MRLENVGIQNFPGRGLVLRGKTSDDRGTLSGTTSSGFTVPAVGGTVSVDFVSTTPLRVDTLLYIPTAGMYRVQAINSATNTTLYNFGFATDTAYVTKNAPPGTVIATGKAISGVLSNCNKSSASAVRISACGLSGMWIEGDNANQGEFISLDVGSNGQRRVKGDNHGLVENSFLGNGYTGFHGATNTFNTATVTTTTAGFTQPALCGAGVPVTGKTVSWTVASTASILAGELLIIEGVGWYRVVAVTDATHLTVHCLRQLGANATGVAIPTGQAIKFPALSFICSNINARSSFVNAYSEDSDATQMSTLCLTLGGRSGNLSEGNALVPGGGFMAATPVRWTAAGQSNVVFQMGLLSSDTHFQFWNAADTTGYNFVYNPTSAITEMDWGSGTSKRAFFLTSAGFANYAGGFLGTERFLVNGVRFHCHLPANLPATSSAGDYYGVGTMVWNPSATGAYWYRCETKVSNNLTWRADRLFLTNATLNFGTIGAGAEVAVTTTFTGARVGDVPHVSLRNRPAGIVIANARVSAANTLEVTLYNYTAAGVAYTNAAVDSDIVTGAV